MADHEELKPCPWCGTIPWFKEFDGPVYCSKCYARGPLVDVEPPEDETTKAIIAWNRRASLSGSGEGDKLKNVIKNLILAGRDAAVVLGAKFPESTLAKRLDMATLEAETALAPAQVCPEKEKCPKCKQPLDDGDHAYLKKLGRWVCAREFFDGTGAQDMTPEEEKRHKPSCPVHFGGGCETPKECAKFAAAKTEGQDHKFSN